MGHSQWQTYRMHRFKRLPIASKGSNTPMPVTLMSGEAPTFDTITDKTIQCDYNHPHSPLVVLGEERKLVISV